LGFAFVDDMDLIVTATTDSEMEVAKKMQESVVTWESLLAATGGCWYQRSVSGIWSDLSSTDPSGGIRQQRPQNP